MNFERFLPLLRFLFSLEFLHLRLWVFTILLLIYFRLEVEEAGNRGKNPRAIRGDFLQRRGH